MPAYSIVYEHDYPDPTLCCLAEVEGMTCAVVNHYHGDLALAHVEYHAAAGFGGFLICSLEADCGYAPAVE